MMLHHFFTLMAMVIIAPHCHKFVALVLCAMSMVISVSLRLGWIA